MAAQIKWSDSYKLQASEASEEKRNQCFVTSNNFGLKSMDSRAFSVKSREKWEHTKKVGKSRDIRKSRARWKACVDKNRHICKNVDPGDMAMSHPLRIYTVFHFAFDFPLETICTKCQSPFSGKNKKNTIKFSSAEFAQRVVRLTLVMLSTLKCHVYF